MFYYGLWIVLFWLFLLSILEARLHAGYRGIWFPGDGLPAMSGAATPLGTTVELIQYESDAALAEALDEAQAMGIEWLRQPLPWDGVEAARGDFVWEPWDRVINAASERGFRLVLVLKRTPSWARRLEERHNPWAPPLHTGDFAFFARLAAERYGEQVYGWQVWDDPNLKPHWGTEVTIDTKAYATFLKLVTPAIRAGDPDAVVATAGLGPTTEKSGFNVNEVDFLHGLYEAGARDYFDAVAIKPYGFWGDAEGPIYSKDVLNFNRVVLTYEVLQHHSDLETPIWLVEGGWAVIPPDWQGEPPPWGADDAEIQQFRLQAAIKRAALEWPWIELISLQPLQPDVSPTDPRRLLALLDEEGNRTPLGQTTADIGRLFFNGPIGVLERQYWENVARPNLQLRYDYAAWIAFGFMIALAARLLWHGAMLLWAVWGPAFRRRPEWLQVTVLASVILLFYVADNRVSNFLLYLLLCLIISWRIDLALAAIAFAIPFFLQVKNFALLQFSMVELLLLPTALAWGVSRGNPLRLPSARRGTSPPRLGGTEGGGRFAIFLAQLKALFWPKDALDWGILLFVLWGAISVSLAQNSYIAAREFRVVVAESVIWFWLIRRAGLSQAARMRLLDILVLSATILSCYGLYQWFFTADIITAEGVRRIKGVYGSPNNLALMLERVIAIVGALALLAPPSRRRRFYIATLPPLVLCLFLTFSRAAWLIGMPAALVWFGYWGGERARYWTIRLVVVGLLALLPFISTERITSTLNFEGGTWFIRLRLWEATVAMLQDYPLFGVGLDNFLYIYDTYRLPEAWREPDLSHPHQILLHFWVALGIPGLLLLLWQQAAFWQKWRHLSQKLAKGTLAWAFLIGLGASMFATFAHGMIDNSFFLVDLAFIWMMTLALIGEWEA
jgi:O-antigen ligase